ncbi:MAG: hypothetical protein QXZ40_01355, partial [Candidatus Micrarchaeia archaeon]
LVVFLITPKAIKKLEERRIVAPDLNKPERPAVPKIGGIVMLLGLSLALLLSLQLHSAGIDKVHMLAAICSITLIAVMGLLDDLLKIPDRYRVLLPVFAAIPLMVTKAGVTKMNLILWTVDFNLGVLSLPLIGAVDINLYSLLLVPIGVVACSNLINLLAGFNGLEAGTGAVVSAFIFLASILLRFAGLHTTETSFIMIGLFGACLAFLFYNWYPARIFPGNVATYMIGASIVAAVVLGNMERVGVIALTPQIIEFLLKMRSKFKAENFGRVGRGGRLYYDGEICSLTHFLMKTIHPTEKQLVLILLLLQIFFGVVAVCSIYA